MVNLVNEMHSRQWERMGGMAADMMIRDDLAQNLPTANPGPRTVFEAPEGSELRQRLEGQLQRAARKDVGMMATPPPPPPPPPQRQEYMLQEATVDSDEELWMAALEATQEACAVDFATRCGDYDLLEPAAELDSGFGMPA